MFLFAWAALFFLLVSYFNEQEKDKHNPNRSATITTINGQDYLELQANRQNHFLSLGEINGQQVTFLLDTGATNTVVPADLADALWLEKGKAATAMTANGPVRVYRTMIDRLQLGPFTLYDVPAEINPGMNQMNEILLGMSALSQLEFTQRNGVLTIKLHQ